MKSKKVLFLLLVLSFTLRIIFYNFPSFTSEEARIAYRGYTLALYGKDELGRSYPLLFDSLDDYQLPVVSYLAVGGELIFGKNEFGARIPFIILGTILVLLTYQIAKFFSQKKLFWLMGASMVAFSPTLIFLSKIPNETIVLTFIFMLLFYLLINNKNLAVIIVTMILAVLVSKLAWFILLPFIIVTTYLYQKNQSKRKRLYLIGASLLIVVSSILLFLVVPQAKRSLSENNFTIFSDVTIKNGIDKLRGQGLQFGWPPLVDRLLFNKVHFLTIGLLHWISTLSPAIYFGQFDDSGLLSYSHLGTWTKILLIPTILGIIFLLKNGERGSILLLIYPLILTFPSMFIYPNINLQPVVLTLPFIALIVVFGFIQLNKKIVILVFLLMVLELMINIYNLTPEYKNTTSLRPNWIKELTNDIFEGSKNYSTSVSDDIVSDIVPYVEWYTLFNPPFGFQVVPSPYKFRQYRLANIRIIGSNESFGACGISISGKLFASIRDLSKIREEFDVKIIKTYKDSNDKDRVYLINNICLK